MRTTMILTAGLLVLGISSIASAQGTPPATTPQAQQPSTNPSGGCPCCQKMMDQQGMQMPMGGMQMPGMGSQPNQPAPQSR